MLRKRKKKRGGGGKAGVLIGLSRELATEDQSADVVKIKKNEEEWIKPDIYRKHYSFKTKENPFSP